MQDLDYRPNWSARTLRRSSTQTIGVISDFVASGAFSSQLLTGASAAARDAATTCSSSASRWATGQRKSC